MNNKKKIALGIIFVVSIALLVFGSGTAIATKKVNHPECPAGWTQIKSQPPSSGFTVTVAYEGTMYIKVATIHFEVPVVSVGDVITPESVSSWPTNKNGKYQEISHVDYCIPPAVPPTTEPPVTTVPPTTEPPVTTAPPTTEPPVTTVPFIVCIDTFDNDLQDPNDPCGTLTTTTTIPVSTTVPQDTPSLPATGSDSGFIPWLAAIVLVGGICVWSAARRKAG